MGKRPLCIAILWHMHQPDYGNVETGEIYLPWTRFHAVKDYYDMAALVAETPGLALTINVVPSLIDQLEAYAEGTARETYASLSQRNAGDLDQREKIFLLNSFFQLPWKQMILPYPRYKELLDRRGTPDPDGKYSSALKRYSAQDYRDLQVWFNLSWCGNELRRHPDVSSMIRKGRDFTEEDKSRLFEAQKEFIGRILPLYRKLMEDHGIEISVSPYYHPILPLLCDSLSAREALPDIPLPAAPFSFPADAHEQVVRAQNRFQEVFGRLPEGMWPSEGAISNPASRLARDLGLRWLASDEGVLQKSLQSSVSGHSGLSMQEKYSAWRHEGGPALFFRDHGLSDLIGFTYGRWGAEEAACDFVERLRQIHDALPDDGRYYVVPVILDGENAWEHYPGNGREFLHLLYRKIVDADFLQSVTMSGFLELEPIQENLPNIVAGSWIYGCLSTWIGHPEKNAAWDALTEARHAFSRHGRQITEPLVREKAFREIMIAEGSDWCWWYGDDHQTQNAVEFDTLFRNHLKNAFRLLGLPYPLGLDIPIKKVDIRRQFRNPVHTISPRLDGEVTDYFEWLAAGTAARAGGGAMHQTVRFIEKVFFGYDSSRFYVRLDIAGGLKNLPPQMSVQLHFVSPRQYRMEAERIDGTWKGTASPSPPPGGEPTAAGGRILEAGVPLDALGISEPDEVRFFITLREGERELERFPATGFLVVPLDPWGLDQEEWLV